MAVLPAGLILCAVSCHRPPAPTGQAKHPDAVAVVAGRVITPDMVKMEIERRFKPSLSPITQEQKQAALQTLIDAEAVYSQALAAGFDQTPDIQARLKSLIVAQYREKRIPRTGPAVSPAEIEEFYHSQQAHFSVLVAVRGAIILVQVPVTATVEKQAESRALAESILNQARAAKTEAEFAELVRQHSDDQSSRYRGGDTGWLRPGGIDDAVIVEALRQVEKPGEFAPILSTQRGLVIAKLLERAGPGVRPLSEVQEAIRYELSRRRLRRAEEDFMANARHGLEIQIDEAALEAIQFPTPAKPQPPRLPGQETARLQQ